MAHPVPFAALAAPIAGWNAAFRPVFQAAEAARGLILCAMLPMRTKPVVLVADDTTLVRWAVRRALKAAGFEVVEAETRSDVLQALVSHSFRLVVLSLALMDDDMHDIARALASAGKSALIVLTESGVAPDVPLSAARVRAVEKPFSVSSIVDAAMAMAPPPQEPAQDSVSL